MRKGARKWIQSVSEQADRMDGQMDATEREVGRMATGVLSIFLNHQGDGEMERNVKMETDSNRQRDEGGSFQWTMSESKRANERLKET